VHTVLRYGAAGTLRHPPLVGRVERGRTEEALDLACGGAVMTGRQWCELTGGLDAVGEAALLPTRVWREVADRLVAETVIADDVAWMLRFEALNRLLNHPRGGREAVAACAEYAVDGRNQAIIEIIGALDNTDHTDAAARITDQISAPSTDRTRHGALLAAVRKARYGHFTPEQINTLVPNLAALARTNEVASGERSLAIQIVHELPPHLAGKLRRALANPSAESSAASRPEPRADAESQLVHLLTARTLARQKRHLPGEHEQMLATLIAEMISDPSSDVRLYTSCLVHAAPYRQDLADVIAEELGRASVLRDSRLAEPLLDALRFLGDARHRPLLERLILAPGLPAAIAAAAAHHLGHVGSHSENAFWTKALSMHLGRWAAHHTPMTTAVLRDLVYALGRAGRIDVLERLRLDVRFPTQARAAAAWWCAIPASVRESAMR
jgi:hypothetical protein